jgi:hypothetical protein
VWGIGDLDASGEQTAEQTSSVRNRWSLEIDPDVSRVVAQALETTGASEFFWPGADTGRERATQ